MRRILPTVILALTLTACTSEEAPPEQTSAPTAAEQTAAPAETPSIAPDEVEECSPRDPADTPLSEAIYGAAPDGAVVLTVQEMDGLTAVHACTPMEGEGELRGLATDLAIGAAESPVPPSDVFQVWVYSPSGSEVAALTVDGFRMYLWSNESPREVLDGAWEMS